MALGSTQPLTGMSEFPGGKCGRCVWLTTLPSPCAVVMKSGYLNFLEPSGPLEACNRTDLIKYLHLIGRHLQFQTKDPLCPKFSCRGDLAPIFCAAQLCILQFSDSGFFLFVYCSSWVWLACCALIVSFVSGLCKVLECSNFFNGIYLL